MKNLGVDVSSKLFVSRKAHLIFPTHRLIDQASELSKGKKKIGSTLKELDQHTWTKQAGMDLELVNLK